MMIQQIDAGLIREQLKHLEKEIQIIRWELTQISPKPKVVAPRPDTTWDALQEAKGLWEREWDAEWKTAWEKA
jgi:hypothetical protein